MARPNNAAAIARHVRGLKEAKAAFQAMPAAFRDRLLHATETTVREIHRNAQGRLRSSPAIRTRALHDHVAWTVNKSSGRGRVGIKSGSTVIAGDARIGTIDRKVRGIIIAGRGGSASTSKGARKINPTRYAHLIEWGSKHAPAEPFMLPSAEGQEQPYLQRCQAAGREAERDLAAIGARTL